GPPPGPPPGPPGPPGALPRPPPRPRPGAGLFTAELFSIEGLGRGAPGRGPGRGPEELAAPAPRDVCPGVGMPWEGAHGLLPGRARWRPWPPGRPPGLGPRPRGFGIPCDGAKGLLPGRADDRPPGFGAAGFGAAGLGAAGFGAAGLGAPGFGAAGLGAAARSVLASGAEVSADSVCLGAAGAGLAPGFGAAFDAESPASAELDFAEAALGPGFAPGLGAGFAPGFGAPGFAAGLAAGFFSPPEDFAPSAGAECAQASLTRRTTGASSVEEAERTNSPISWSFSRTFLLVVPSSFASSWTRGFATVLLSGFFPGQERTSSMKSSTHLTALSNSVWVSS